MEILCNVSYFDRWFSKRKKKFLSACSCQIKDRHKKRRGMSKSSPFNIASSEFAQDYFILTFTKIL